MTNCPHCSSYKFLAESEKVVDETTSRVGWVNTCKDCGGKSVFDEIEGRQYKVHEWPPSA